MKVPLSQWALSRFSRASQHILAGKLVPLCELKVETPWCNAKNPNQPLPHLIRAKETTAKAITRKNLFRTLDAEAGVGKNVLGKISLKPGMSNPVIKEAGKSPPPRGRKKKRITGNYRRN
ncbi:Hypothetical protein NTJ_09877 [Nesidiocoris tenuis]|uniref:Uncharacterized protein n=1 Tax=Nesidiocoris tenuis TaxID=355587 RepID=A0ABN7AY06_9HEMI|nr:Hypothetical protein NTJ_09877 [Nesidiocoris tenuis]